VNKWRLRTFEVRLGDRWLVANPKRALEIEKQYGKDGAAFAAAAMVWLVFAALCGVGGGILILLGSGRATLEISGFSLLTVATILLFFCIFRLRVARLVKKKNSKGEDDGELSEWDGQFGF
jgi:hypothetical protein